MFYILSMDDKNITMEDKTMNNTIESLKLVFDVLDSFDTREDKLYWLDVMVIMGDITKAQAGYIVHSLGLLE
jgi:hypothetical protein